VLTTLASAAVVTAAAGLAVAAVRLLADRGDPASTWPQRAPFLGGGWSETHAWNQYHPRYYPMTLVFIAFEMEMMFMYPWAVVFVRQGAKALAEMGMFLALLSIGIVYAWREGAFRWQ
jgi:NADH:ubiquinone oxidoreductase subunit 3 (subunit A)